MLGRLGMIVRHRACYTDCINGIDKFHDAENITQGQISEKRQSVMDGFSHCIVTSESELR